MASAMEASPYSSKISEGSEFSLREWDVKAQRSGEKTKSRRYSASYIRSFKEETRSFRSSNITFSSATSSPAYPLKDGIDPSTYSFNTAIRALQARSYYNNWECLSPDGLALNSKWNEAEKYICNPLSGEVPLECLSSKALISSGRSFRNLPNRVITISDDPDPAVNSSRNALTKISSTDAQEEDDEALQFPVSEKKKEGKTRDVGTQSTLPYLSSSSPSPASTPSITDRSIKELPDSPFSNAKSKPDQEVEEKDEDRETEKRHELGEQVEQPYRQSGCFSWIKKKRLKEKGRHIKINIFITSCQRKEALK